MDTPKRREKKVPSQNDDALPLESAITAEPSWAAITHFVPRDFTCKCNGLCDHPVVISLDLVSKLDRIREEIGVPINIVSGTRCERHNQKVGGVLRSAHVPKNGISHAADVHCPGNGFRFAFLKSAMNLFHRIGIGRDFIHVDDDPELPTNMVWLYDASVSSDMRGTESK